MLARQTLATPASGPVPRRAALGAVAGALAGFPPSGRSQTGSDWPRQPVRYICPFPPGGATDALSRLYCARMGEQAGQPFLVENRSGSGGVVGADAIAKARPDGHTIGWGGLFMLAAGHALYAKLPLDPERDFTLVCGLWLSSYVLVANADLPARDVPELLALLRANPGRFSYATPGVGSPLHLAGEMLKQAAGLDMTHVPYRGGAPALLDLLAGRVHLLFDTISGPLAAVREGKVRALAVLDPRRNPVLPGVPALAEAVPGVEMAGGIALCGPAGLPPRVVERLSSLSKQALESPELVRGFRDLGIEPWWAPTEEVAAFRAAEEARLAPVVRASGARIE